MNAPTNVPIGRLSHRLTLEREVRTPDEGGGAFISWESVGEMWGAVEAISGGEGVQAGRLAGTVDTRITIRHRSDASPKMRFKIGMQTFAIQAILDGNGSGRFLTCLCQRCDL